VHHSLCPGAWIPATILSCATRESSEGGSRQGRHVAHQRVRSITFEARSVGRCNVHQCTRFSDSTTPIAHAQHLPPPHTCAGVPRHWPRRSCAYVRQCRSCPFALRGCSQGAAQLPGNSQTSSCSNASKVPRSESEAKVLCLFACFRYSQRRSLERLYLLVPKL
jgi:hypothetical protein